MRLAAPGRARCARDGVCFHSDASGFTALPRFASVITLAKWRHPFENSASLAKQPTASTRRGRLPFESTASLAKRPRPCPDRRTFQCETPPRWDGRPYSRGSALRSCSYPPGVTGCRPYSRGSALPPRPRREGQPDRRKALPRQLARLPVGRRRTENGPGPRTGSDRKRTWTANGLGPQTDPDRERARTVSGLGL